MTINSQPPAAADGPEPRPRRRARILVATLGWGLCTLAWLYVALIHWGARPFIVDLMADFALHMGALLVVLGGLLLCLRPRAPGVVLALAGAVLLIECRMAIHAPVSGAAPAGSASLKLVHYNCYGQITINDDAFMRWLEAEDPDIVSLVDPPLGLAAAQPWLVKKYPYRVEPAPGAEWDVVLLSRIPMELAKLRRDDDPNFVFSFLARRGVLLHVPGGPTLLWSAMHPQSPRTSAHWRDSINVVKRDAPLIAEYLAAGRGPVLITGDFNSAPTGIVHQTFRAISGLTPWGNCWPAGTWPSQLTPWFAIPIDRLWSSPGVVCRSWRVGPRFRSDHLPLIAEFSLPPPEQTPAPQTPPNPHS